MASLLIDLWCAQAAGESLYFATRHLGEPKIAKLRHATDRHRANRITELERVFRSPLPVGITGD